MVNAVCPWSLREGPLDWLHSFNPLEGRIGADGSASSMSAIAGGTGWVIPSDSAIPSESDIKSITAAFACDGSFGLELIIKK